MNTKKPKIVFEDGKPHLDLKQSNEVIHEQLVLAIKEIIKYHKDIVDKFMDKNK